ncbi:MAG: SRPBCC domain-containing protein [Chloroflexi bacterium]|nr:SRPBCC domain-containing protein [Chloroflexota bacterium]
MKELRTEIEIQASPEQVWQVLTDLNKYPEWNPFIHHASGQARAGDKVDITFRSGSKEMTLHCTVIKAAPNRELRWKYHVILPAFFQGEHSFLIEPTGDNSVRFIDRETFTGLLIPLQASDIDTHSRRGFEEMDKALKARAETTR